MSFTSTVKTDLLARIEAIEPTPEVNPLQAALNDALAMNVTLGNQLAAMTEQRDALSAKILAAQQALA